MGRLKEQGWGQNYGRLHRCKAVTTVQEIFFHLFSGFWGCLMCWEAWLGPPVPPHTILVDEALSLDPETDGAITLPCWNPEGRLAGGHWPHVAELKRN